MKRARILANDLLNALYPLLCTCCGNPVAAVDHAFCLSCLGSLPFTGFHAEPDNVFERHFWGRIPLFSGAALVFFVPGGLAQNMLHNIKYRNRPEFAIRVGEYYGRLLRTSDRFGPCDCIVPVPLHWRKLRKRGFNQSKLFAQGLATATGKPVLDGALIRRKHTQTQTRKSRFERIDNLRESFAIRHADRLQNRHVLLVDDVLTTGATLEACGLVLLGVPGVALSFVTIACGRI